MNCRIMGTDEEPHHWETAENKMGQRFLLNSAQMFILYSEIVIPNGGQHDG